MRRIIIASLSVVAFFVGRASLHAQEKVVLTDADKNAVAEVRKLGGHVMELAQNDSRLEVAYHLTDGEVTNEFLVPLKELKPLVHLNLRGTEVTDDGLANLSGLSGLVRLHLEKTKITDKGLEHLKGLTNLEYLNLYGTEVTDAGLSHLEGLKKLKRVYLWETKVTDAGAEKLKQAVPEIQIVRGLELAKPAEEKKEEPKTEEKKE